MTAVARTLVCVSDPPNPHHIVTVGTVRASRILMALPAVCKPGGESAAAQVRVRDRSVVKTTDAETRVVAPDGLHPAITACVQAVPGGTRGPWYHQGRLK